MPIALRPTIAVNYVMSLNGQWARGDGRSVGLGSPIDRGLMDLLRAESDAIVTGGATLRADDPWLHVRQTFARQHRDRCGHLRQPQAIVATRRGSVSQTARCMRRPPGIAPEAWQAPWVAAVPEGGWTHYMSELSERGIRELLVEAGPQLVASLMAEALVDEIFVTVAPCWLSPMALAAAPTSAQAMQLVAQVAVGNELFLHWRRADAVATTGRGRSPLLALLNQVSAAQGATATQLPIRSSS